MSESEINFTDFLGSQVVITKKDNETVTGRLMFVSSEFISVKLKTSGKIRIIGRIGVASIAEAA